MIDRIAYSPYGEATRTLRSDVNGDGFVNQSDYTGIIRPRNGATIGTAGRGGVRSGLRMTSSECVTRCRRRVCSSIRAVWVCSEARIVARLSEDPHDYADFGNAIFA